MDFLLPQPGLTTRDKAEPKEGLDWPACQDSPVHLATSSSPATPGPGSLFSELTSHCSPVGELLPASVGERGMARVGRGCSPVHILHTNPQVLILAGFVFILIFLF
jgi:hypothetical protein